MRKILSMALNFALMSQATDLYLNNSIDDMGLRYNGPYIGKRKAILTKKQKKARAKSNRAKKARKINRR